MSLTCNICNIDISGNESFSKFDCQHATHLSCFFNDSYEYGLRYQCKTCNRLTISQDKIDNIHDDYYRRNHPEIDTSNIQNLFTTNKQFKRDVTLIKKLYRKESSCQNLFHKTLSKLKKNYKEEIQSFSRIIETIILKYQVEAKNTQENKNLKLSRSAYTRSINSITRKYNITERELLKFLNINPYLRKWRYRTNVKYAFRFIL